MPRYKLTVEYDGGPYLGWQRQKDGPSVQQAVERAIRAFSGEETVVHGAGRTDAGVHALGQVAHVDLKKPWPPFKLWSAVNAHLQDDPIAILEVDAVDDEFHARFSALGRNYLYRIITRRAPLAVDAGRAWNVKAPLDVDAMVGAAERLIGQHDFTTFRSSECQAASPVKTLDAIDIVRLEGRGGNLIEIRVSARSFLHNQVRSIVGSLKLAGEGKWTAGRMAEALEARSRSACGPVAPAHGLYLEKVDY